MFCNKLAAGAVMLATVFTMMNVSPVYAKESGMMEEISAGAQKALTGTSETGEVKAGAAEVLDSQVSKLLNSTSENEAEDTDSENVIPELPEALVMADVNDAMNIRAEADEDSELVGKFYKDCAGEILEQQGDWTKLKSGDLVGWAKNDYLLFADDAKALATNVGQLTATVKADTLRIRAEADEEAEVFGLLAEGETIQAVDETNGWVKVQYADETVGYVAGDYVDVAYQLNTGETMEEIEAREAAEKAAEEKKEAERKKLEASRTTKTTTTNTGAVAAGVDDVTLLAALIQSESGRECYEGQLAVGAVVVNRAKGRYGSIYNAVYAPGQFGPAASGKVAMIAAAGPSASCMQAAQEALSGTTNVGGATHFRNIRSGYSGVVIGNHVFW